MRTSRALLGIVAAALTMGASGPTASIERIEKGLRPPVLVEGDKTWTLEERMKLFHVPGLSVAVYRDFQIAWAKAYGFADETFGMFMPAIASLSDIVRLQCSLRAKSRHLSLERR